MNRFFSREDRTIKAFITAWAVIAAFVVTFWVVVIWAIVKLVGWITDGGLDALIH